ncbi:NmrA family NAD(P)-binding protein [Bdellovibrio sp. NC01]|uniref:NmrA family NAD(P)-binding protein n=1 Tax=Bdellovibrio sp. NC01 TaxID=2220073 RepID=UPI00115C28E8|nr:NmrA family NAD(P)-binding protein [Bdellovibrio sp. NC01]QDK38942.1 nucleoside-diphosphate sugar epimerase [Bdellovibrio sp. NC01]
MIFVMGATGHIGSKIVTHLLANGQEVRCLARHFPDKDAYEGAELIEGDANSVATVTDCMRHCTAAFTMIPPNMKAHEMRFSQNKIGEVIGEAIEESGIRKVVNLSSYGADLNAGTGPILALHDQELRLNELDADIVHLRPVSFMENLLAGIPAMVSMNRYYGIPSGETPIDLIATRDIAARAAFLLINPTFKGHTVEYLLGERTLTYNEVIRALGEAVEKPDMEYMEAPEQEIYNYLVGAGMSEDVANNLVELDRAIANGTIHATVTRDKLNTTATSIEDFARTTFKNAYQAAMEKDRMHRTISYPPDEARM